jgi:hypothetical protein
LIAAAIGFEPTTGSIVPDLERGRRLFLPAVPGFDFFGLAGLGVVSFDQ